jgi:hypothetical protein
MLSPKLLEELRTLVSVAEKTQRALTQRRVFENQTPLGVNNLRHVVHSDDHRAATTDSDTDRYHGQTTANHRQTMYFDACLEWFRWAISRVRSSQVVRRGVLGDAQIVFEGVYGLVPKLPVEPAALIRVGLWVRWTSAS